MLSRFLGKANRQVRPSSRARLRVGLTLEALESRIIPAVYDVGPGLAYASVNAVPWEALAPGDTVNIHWRSDPYREKVLLSSSGTAQAPIRIVGIPNGNGQLPILDGRDATTRPQNPFAFAGHQERGLIVVGMRSGQDWGYKPSYIHVENLELRNAHQQYGFTDQLGNQRTYRFNAAGLWVERGEHVVVRGCVLTSSGNGLFVSSSGEEATTSREILVEGNYIHGNGNAGSDREHNVYTEAAGITFQYNRIGSPRPGATANGIKDRSAGTVVRYNWFDSTPARPLDLVNPQGGAALLVPDPRFQQTYVYGNVLVNGPPSVGGYNPVHYGGDDGLTQNYRKGTLHFYHNTVVLRSDQTGAQGRWRTILFRLDTNDETADIRNNIFLNLPYTTGATPSELTLMQEYGVASFGVNWVSPGWVRSNTALTFRGTVTGTANFLSNAANDPGFVDVAANDFRLRAGAPSLDVAWPLAPEVLPAHDLTHQYVVHQAGAPRPVVGAARDLGAFEFGEFDPNEQSADLFSPPDRSRLSRGVGKDRAEVGADVAGALSSLDSTRGEPFEVFTGTRRKDRLITST